MTPQAHRDPRPTDRRNEHAVRRFIEAVYGAGELQHVDAITAPEYVGNWSGTDDVQAGRAGVKAHAARFRRAFGRLDVEVEAVRVTDETFEARWTARGRLERPFLSVEPSVVIGRPGEEPHGPAVTLTGVTRGTVRSGALVESATAWTMEGADIEAAAGFDDSRSSSPTPVAPSTGPVPASSIRR